MKVLYEFSPKKIQIIQYDRSFGENKIKQIKMNSNKLKQIKIN